MTTGSWNRGSWTSQPDGSFIGVKWDRSWIGGDRTIVKTPPHVYQDVNVGEVGLLGRTLLKNGPVRIHDSSINGSRAVKRVRDVPHPYDMGETRLQDATCTVRRPSGTFPFYVDVTGRIQHLFGATTWAAAPLLTANDQIKLVGKLRDSIDGSSFNMGVFIGELGDTLGLLGGTALTLGMALGHAGRGDFVSAADVLFRYSGRNKGRRGPVVNVESSNKKAIASKWLELQYGWMPLLQDAKSAAEMLAHYLNAPARKTYRVGVRREVTFTSTTSIGAGYFVEGKSVRAHRRGLIAHIEEKGSIPQLLGLTNPALVAWERLPFSFVADWFIPISSWMEARGLVERLTGTFITSDKQTGRRLTPDRFPVAGPIWLNRPMVEFSNVLFSRSISTTVKVPMPTFKPLGSVASWQHCANAVGLLVANFGTPGKAR